MNSRMQTAIGVIAMLTLSFVSHAQENPAPRTVRVTAEGFNREHALSQALRRALEEGAGVQLAAYSQVENFTLLRDTIYSRASGVITDYKILEERPASGGGVRISLEAVVRPDAVAQTWGEVQHLLDQLGRPRIMVWIDERIDEKRQDDSIVASKLEEMLTKAGFDLVAPKALEAAAREKNLDTTTAAGLARSAGAHLLVQGVANANQAGLESIYGVPAAFYNCDVQARVFATDTGRLLASESLPLTRAGVRSRKEFSPQAARAALVMATFPDEAKPVAQPPLGQRLYESVMQQWSTQLSGGGDVELHVQRLDFKSFVKLREALEGLPDNRSVHADFTAGDGAYRIRTTLSGPLLAERLLEPPFHDYLEVLTVKPNRIEAKAVGAP